ncbi:hypothetical protein V8E51_002545 [Hyaloscypha variabilis]
MSQQNCSLAVLDSADRNLTSIRTSLCTISTLQYELYLCILDSCSQVDQIISINVLQDDTCFGVPFPSRKTYIIQAEIILTVFTYAAIISRLISRLWVARKIWWDDWIVIAAAVLMVPNTAIPIYTAYHGFGTHAWNVRVQDQVLIPKLYYAAQIFYTLMQCLAKFSILFIYLRIFPLPNFRLIIKICIGWMACHTLIFTLGTALQCLPVQTLWDPSIGHKCIDIHAFAVSGAVFSIFEDLVIMLLPISELKGLPFTIRKRIALCLMFALGSFACITSMIRLKYVKNYYPNIDASWENVDIVIWSDIETYTAIICSCLMCIRPLLKNCFPSLFPPAQNQFVTRNNFNTRNNFAAQNSNWTNSNFDSQASNATLASTGLTHLRGAKTNDKFRSSNSRFQSASFGLGKESWDAGNGIGNEGDFGTRTMREMESQQPQTSNYELVERQ